MNKLTLGMAFLSAAWLGLACDDDSGSDATDAGGDDASVALDAAAGGAAGSDAGALDTGPAPDASPILQAKAVMASVGGSTVTGSVNFVQSGNEVTVTISIAGATMGQHGVHVHTNPSCADTPAMGDAGLVVAGAAGGHFNPGNVQHGSIESDAGTHHPGDFGNVTVGPSGAGGKIIKTTEWKVADVVNRSMIFHAGMDDLTTDPTGNSGGRVACGVIAPL